MGMKVIVSNEVPGGGQVESVFQSKGARSFDYDSSCLHKEEYS